MLKLDKLIEDLKALEFSAKIPKEHVNKLKFSNGLENKVIKLLSRHNCDNYYVNYERDYPEMAFDFELEGIEYTLYSSLNYYTFSSDRIKGLVDISFKLTSLESINYHI